MLEAVLLLLILAIDQISKHFTILYLKPLGSIPILDSVLSLTYVENRGASFGMLQGHQWLFLVITALVVLVICWFLLSHRNEPLFLRLALTFLAAGALGNQNRQDLPRVRGGHDPFPDPVPRVQRGGFLR